MQVLQNIRERRFINFPMLLKTVGWLLMIESVFICVPTIVSLCYGEDDWSIFALTVAITFAVGFILNNCVHATYSRMARREGFLLTGFTWVIFSLFGMLPLIFASSSHLSITDAFFESVSCFTTTGASAYLDAESLSHGVHIWRAIMQWTGGMGIILFTLAVIPMLNSSGGMQMFNAEVTGITHDKVRPRISQTAKALWVTYFVLTACCAILLMIGHMDVFDSICYAFGTLSTGGYSTRASVDFFNSDYIKVVITVFMFLGGVNFALLVRNAIRNPRRLWDDDVFRWFIIIIIAITAISSITLLSVGVEDTWREAIIDPLFQTVSTITSTGYVVNSISQWGPFVVGLLMILVFIGGCAGSTSGGAKLDRIIFLFKHIHNELYRCIHPNAVLPVRLNGRVLPPQLVNKVVVFVCLYMLTIIIGGLIMTIFGLNVKDALLSSLMCISNASPNFGLTSFGEEYSVLAEGCKWVLAWIMLIGRLEVFTIVIVFTPSFWHK